MKILHLPEAGDTIINIDDKKFSTVMRFHVFVFDYKSSVATQPKEVP